MKKQSFKNKIARQLRQHQTEAENFLWQVLRDRKIEHLKFRRQHPIKDFIVDFFCLEKGIIIELDGGYHETAKQKEKDNLRDELFHQLGYHVLRYSNETALVNTKKIVADITKLNRSENMRILSTKILTPAQKNHLIHAGFRYVERNFIRTTKKDFSIPQNAEHIIFTSQKAVEAIAEKTEQINLDLAHAYCVGEKTAAGAENVGFDVVEIASNAEDLAKMLIESYADKQFTFLCGKQRRDELPQTLKEANITVKEIAVYETMLSPVEVKGHFDGILLFSPSAVQSFVSKNIFSEETVAFCIGNTTATTAQKHTNKVIIANKPSVENTLVQVVKHFNTNKLLNTDSTESLG